MLLLKGTVDSLGLGHSSYNVEAVESILSVYLIDVLSCQSLLNAFE